MTPHFTLAELTATNTGIPNVPNEHQKRCIRSTAWLLELVRSKFGKPLYINSCFRCRDVNNAVGGARASLHLVGAAADINTRPFNYEEKLRLYELLRETHPKELIPYDTFVHVGWDFSKLGADPSTFDGEFPEIMSNLK